jgi:hypothetical protein
MFNPNQAFPLVQKVEICPKLPLTNAELYGLVLASRLTKRIPSNLGSLFSTLGAKQRAKNAQSWPPSFFGPNS